MKKALILGASSVALVSTSFAALHEIAAPCPPFAPGEQHVECVMDGVDFGGQNDQEYFWYAPESRLMNGGFESAGRYWRNNNQGLDVRNSCIVESEAHTGRRCLSTVNGVMPHGLGIKPGKYTLSFWCKAPAGVKRASVNISLFAFNGKRGNIQGKKYDNKRFPCTDKWTRHTWEIDWDETAFTFSLGGGGLVDDIQFAPAGQENPEVVNPFGLELKTQDGLGRAYCDITKPISVALDFSGPVGSKGKLDIEITDFFKRTLKTMKDVDFAIPDKDAVRGYGSTEIPLWDLGMFPHRGVFVIRVHVKPENGHDFVDHLRFAAYKFADATAEHRFLHQVPANSADHKKTEYYRQMKSLGVVPRDNSVVRTVPPEWLDNPKKPPYWYRPWEEMPERIKSVNEQGGVVFGWTYNRTTLHFLRDMGVTNLSDQASISDEDAKKLEEAVAKTVKLFPTVDIWCSPNEVSGHWRTVKDGKLEDYARALMAMQNGVRKANPKGRFLAYSTCNLGEQGRREIFECFAAAQRLVPGYKFDAVDVHPYRSHPDNPDLDADIDVFNEKLAELGYDKTFEIHGLEGCYYYPFIMSQWNSIGPWAGTSQKDRFSSFGRPGYSLGWGERIATGMMLRDKLILYKHSDQVKGGTAWGINMLDAQHVMAPFVATAAQTELLGNAKFLEDVRFAPNCRAYVFDDKAGHVVAAFWRADQAFDFGRKHGETITLDAVLLRDVEIFDLLGDQVKGKVEKVGGGGQWSVKLPLSGYPVYLRLPIARKGDLVKALNESVIPGQSESPIGFDFKMRDPQSVSIVAENTLTRDFDGAYAFEDGVKHALKLASRESKSFDYTLPKALPFDTITRVEFPMVVSSPTGVVSNEYKFNVLPVVYSKSMPDWEKLPLVELKYRAQEVFSKSRGETFDADTCSGGFKIAWNEGHLYIRFEIKDDVFAIRNMGPRITNWWSNDTFQMFFDTFGDGPMKKLRGFTGFDGNDMSYDVMPTNETDAVVFRRHAPDHQLTGGVQGGLLRNVVVPEVGCKHRYDHERHLRVLELDFPARMLRPMRLEVGSVPGFAVKVWDRDDPEVGNNKNGGAKGSLTNIDPRLGTAFGSMHEYAMLLFVGEGK